jgi:hypothetical protein
MQRQQPGHELGARVEHVQQVEGVERRQHELAFVHVGIPERQSSRRELGCLKLAQRQERERDVPEVVGPLRQRRIRVGQQGDRAQSQQAQPALQALAGDCHSD